MYSRTLVVAYCFSSYYLHVLECVIARQSVSTVRGLSGAVVPSPAVPAGNQGHGHRSLAESCVQKSRKMTSSCPAMRTHAQVSDVRSTSTHILSVGVFHKHFFQVLEDSF